MEDTSANRNESLYGQPHLGKVQEQVARSPMSISPCTGFTLGDAVAVAEMWAGSFKMTKCMEGNINGMNGAPRNATMNTTLHTCLSLFVTP